jgi:hypothetical protein
MPELPPVGWVVPAVIPAAPVIGMDIIVPPLPAFSATGPLPSSPQAEARNDVAQAATQTTCLRISIESAVADACRFRDEMATRRAPIFRACADVDPPSDAHPRSLRERVVVLRRDDCELLRRATRGSRRARRRTTHRQRR